jgi:hypothetical protein
MSAREHYVAKAFRVGGAKGSPSLVVVIPRAIVKSQGFDSKTIFTVQLDGKKVIFQDMADLLRSSEQERKGEF